MDDIADLPLLDLSDRAVWQDLHTPLAEALARSPVARTPDGGVTVLGLQESEAVLKDPRMVSADLFAMAGVTSSPVSDWWRQVMFSKNPPEHTRLRSLVSRVFTPRAVARLRPAIRARAEQIIVPAAAAGALDTQGGLGHQLPLAVMSDLLDIPEAERETFGEWTSTLGLAFGAIADVEVRARVEDALAHLDEYVRGLVDDRASHPGDDLLSALIEARDGSDRLSADELVALVENLLFAGHDTTRGALAAMVVLLARHPDAYRALAANPALVPSAVEEVLRYEPISFGTARFAAQETTIAGVVVAPGTAVGLCLVSAARDPRRYRDPQVFDVRRDEGLTPAFGAGIHYCVGAALARAELEEALTILVDNAAELSLTEEPQWVPFASIRRYRSPVTVALTR